MKIKLARLKEKVFKTVMVLETRSEKIGVVCTCSVHLTVNIVVEKRLEFSGRRSWEGSLRRSVDVVKEQIIHCDDPKRTKRRCLYFETSFTKIWPGCSSGHYLSSEVGHFNIGVYVSYLFFQPASRG